MRKYISDNMKDYEVYTLMADQSGNPLVQFLPINQVVTTDAWGKNALSYPAYKINVFVKGECNVIIGDKVVQPEYGDICILRPHEIHIGQIPRTDHLEYYEFAIVPSALDSILGSGQKILQVMHAQTDNFIHFPSSITESIIHYCSLMRQSLRENHPESAAVAYAYALLIFSLISRHCQNKFSLSAKRKLPEDIAKALQYIDTYYTSDICLDDLAAYVNVSISYLIRHFKETVGLTPYQYIQKRRMEQAKNLLGKGASVVDTCRDCGFSSCSCFISVFKKHMGVTPKQYRQSIMSGDI